MDNMDFSQFFAGMDTTESYAILVAFFLCFLLGLLIGLLLRGRRISKYKKQVKELKKKLDETNTLLTNSTQELTVANQKIEQLKAENYQFAEKLNVIETEKDNAYSEVLQLNSTIESLQKNANSDAPNEQLQQQNSEYLAKIEALQATIAQLENKNSQLDASLAESQTKIIAASSNHNNDGINSRLASLEERITNLVNDNAQLRNDLANLSPVVGTPITNTAEPQEADLLKTDKAVLDTHISSRQVKNDDLTKIDGIGDFLQKQLNEQGIYTYAQIAKFSAYDIQELTDKIGYLPGRIEKDQWVAQAKALVEQQIQTATVGSNTSKDNRDLKIIEGIGPKIEQLLKAADITTWQKLAIASKEDIEAILHAAGNRYKMHDPTTWPKQAAMAADGRWDELNKWQDELKGGRE